MPLTGVTGHPRPAKVPDQSSHFVLSRRGISGRHSLLLSKTLMLPMCTGKAHLPKRFCWCRLVLVAQPSRAVSPPLAAKPTAQVHMSSLVKFQGGNQRPLGRFLIDRSPPSTWNVHFGRKASQSQNPRWNCTMMLAGTQNPPGMGT
jgi:hypothetical protein